MPAFLMFDPFLPGVLRYLNATPTQVGNTFGLTDGAGTGVNESKQRNRVVQFQGQIYAMARDGVYQKDDPTTMTGGWTQVIAFTNPDTSNPGFSGLYVWDNNGSPGLVGLWKASDGSNSHRWVKFDGTTWTQGGPNNLNNFNVYTDAIVFQNVLHTMHSTTGGGNSMAAFDVSIESHTGTTGVIDADGIVSFCIFQGRLFALYNEGGTEDKKLAEFTGGVWVEVSTIDAVSDTGPGTGVAQFALFTDGINLFALYANNNASGDDGWRCQRSTDGLVWVDITTTVLPASLRSTNDGGTFSANPQLQRFYPTYDVDASPGTVSIFLYYATNGTDATTLTMYQWNGTGSVITQVDTGGDVTHSIPSGFPNHGERIWSPGELDVKIAGRTAVTGGEQVSFTAYGGGSGFNFKLFYSTNGHPDLQEATLAGPVTGGSATLNGGLNRVEGVAADGTTVYTVVWDISADGITPGERVIRAPQILV